MRDRLILNHLLTSAWAMHLPVLQQLSAVVARHAAGGKLSAVQITNVIAGKPDRQARRREQHNLSGGRAYAQCDGIAVIEISGVLSKHAAGVDDVSQPTGTSCDEITDAIVAAAGADDIRAIMLAIDSPGGAVNGIAELSDLIFETARAKPVIAQVDEMAASAAYWLASQCADVYIGETGQAGAIGVYTVLQDLSEYFAEELRTQVHVVKAGKHKGDFTPGTEITEDQLAEVQRDINALYDVFVEHVARGLDIARKDVRSIADGRIWTGRQAVSAGVAHGLQGFDETLTQMVERFGTGRARPSNERTTMSSTGTRSDVRVFQAMIDREMASGKTRPQAVSAAAKKDPEAHNLYLKALNPHMAHAIK